MKLEDFVKDLAQNLNSGNAETYKKQASALVMNVSEMSGEELANMVNSMRSYDEVLEKIFEGDKKSFTSAVKKIMKETEYKPFWIKEYYLKNKRQFNSFNAESLNFIANPTNIDIKDMTEDVINYWLDNPNTQMYNEGNMTNHFQKVIDTNDKKIVTLVTNNKNFKNAASQYPMRTIITQKQELLTKKSFDKIFTRMMEIINSQGWNTDFSKELAPAIKSKFLMLKHFKMLSQIQQSTMVDFAKSNGITVSTDLQVHLYDTTGDETFLPQDVKDAFIF